MLELSGFRKMTPKKEKPMRLSYVAIITKIKALSSGYLDNFQECANFNSV